MRFYTVWFENSLGNPCLFVSSVPGEKLAETIMLALEEEGFVTKAWIEAD
jgi:hypothetical protein